MKFLSLAFLLTGVFSLNVPAFGDETDTQILILVGPKPHAPGKHEVATGARLMAHTLNHAENFKHIRVIMAEERELDLEKAAGRYADVIQRFDAGRERAGNAIFRRAECLRKLGDVKEAIPEARIAIAGWDE
jgi:hypothetical protein